MAPHRTILVDDSQECVDFVLAGSRELTMVARARSGAEALALTEHLQPELVLMDFTIPDMSVVEVIRQIKARPHAPRVVILSKDPDYHYRNAVLQAGADGFVSKSRFGPRTLAWMDRLWEESAMTTGDRPVEAGPPRDSIPNEVRLSVARSVALVVIALSCLVGVTFMSWHYWQEEQRAKQHEQDQQRQRFLNYWEREAGK